MDDIDKYIAELKAQQEIKDYVEHNIYPERLLSKPVRVVYKPDSLRELNLMDYSNENISDHIRELKTCIEKCKNVENSIEKIETQQKESCPKCLEVIKSIDYFVPMCGHKICRCCAMSNLFNNKHTGTLCSLCREKIF
jgi:hypothetical protein